MFISAGNLIKNYGIDERIAKFFVDREPPKNNLYWQGKLLYLRPEPGFLSIPLIVDLLFKSGVDIEQLLSDPFISVLEQVAHFSALEETRKITAEVAIQECQRLAESNCSKIDWLNEVTDYLKGGKENNLFSMATPFTALHRGDIFLFSTTTLDFPDSSCEKITKQWFALISTLLLLDDAEDIETDKQEGEENAFLESGLNAAGIKRIIQVFDQNISIIGKINAVMASQLERQFRKRCEMPDIIRISNTLS